ncbi:MAG: hypothetical protein JWL63_1660 [Rhodocyclales bacterium]|nr:hypothetical protein [Rhodocyclales bacterium]
MQRAALQEGAVYRERGSRKAARRVVVVVMGLFVAAASTAVVALVIMMASTAEAREWRAPAFMAAP